MSNLSVGSGVIVVFLITGSPDRVSALSSRVTRDPYPASYPRPPAGGAGQPVAVSCCLSATGVRFSVIRFPPRSWALLTVGLPANGRTSTGLPRSARTSSDRGGCPLYPGDDGAHPGPGTVPGRRLPHLSGNVPAPRLRHSTWQGFTPRGINEGSSNSPVRSSPHPPPPGWNEQPLRLSPELRTSPTKSQTTHVGVGTGQLSTDLEQRSTTSADPPIERVRS